MGSVSFEVVECRGGLDAKSEYRLVLFSTGNRDGGPKSVYKRGADGIVWNTPFGSILTLKSSESVSPIPITLRLKPGSRGRHGRNLVSYRLDLTRDCRSETFELVAIKPTMPRSPRLFVTITVTGLGAAEEQTTILPSSAALATPIPGAGDEALEGAAISAPAEAGKDTANVRELLSTAKLASEDASSEQAKIHSRTPPLGELVDHSSGLNTAAIGDAMSSGLARLDSLTKIIDIASDIHPLVRGAWSLFNVAYTLIRQQSDLDGKIELLIQALDANCMFAGVLAANQNTEAAKSILRNILRAVVNGATLVKEYCIVRKSKLSVFKFVGSAIASQVDTCLETLDTFRRELGDHTVVSIQHDVQILASTLSRNLENLNAKADRVDKFVQLQEHDALLAQMPYAPEADRALRSDERGCLPSTRAEILDAIVNWAIGAELDASQTYVHGLHSESRVLWLCGVAGSGKSSIAISAARALHSMGRLVALYGFETAFQASLNPTNLFSTIARQRAESRTRRKRQLVRTLEHMDRHQRATTSATEQFRCFLASASPEDAASPFDDIVVIDAFDESGSVSQRAAALLALSPEAPSSMFPANVRVIVTSRYDPDVARRLESVSHHDKPLCSVLQMEDIHPRHTERDIEVYVTYMLRGAYGLETARAAGDLARLAVTAEHSFQWASTACRYIIDDDDHDGARLPYERLQETLATRGGLDDLYLSVLDKSFGSSIARDSPTTKALRMILGSIVCAREPMSVQVIAALASFDQSVQAVDLASFHILAQRLSSIVTGAKSVSSPLVALHTSFTDFLRDEKRSRSYAVSAFDTHLHLALASLAVMKRSLRFNICCLETSFLRNSEVPDLAHRVKEHISSELSYACRFWPAHVAAARVVQSRWTGFGPIEDPILEFLHNKMLLLAWLEVMCLTGSKAIQYLDLLYPIGIQNKDISDLLRFATFFAIPLSASVPHIYLSALAFAPSHSPLAAIRGQFPRLVRPDTPLVRWPRIRHTFRHQSAVNCVAFSADGKLVAAGTRSGDISVWDVYSGKEVLPRLPASPSVLSIAFSPKEYLLASGSSSNVLQLWDTRTMSAVGMPLVGHSDSIRSVTFSPDGTLLASGSDDMSIRLWDTHTRSAIRPPLVGHWSFVESVAFSPDGMLLASASWDETIRLWDVRTGQMIGKPLEGHEEFVCSVAFSSDGSLLASGSWGNTVRLWDVQTQSAFGEPLRGHKGAVRCVAFLPTLPMFASCSDDRSVKLWNTFSRSEVGPPFISHTDAVSSVVSSPDTTMMASGSFDKSVLVWEPIAFGRGEIRATEFNVKHFAALSRDRGLLASAFEGNGVQLWDLRTGSAVGKPLAGSITAENSIYPVAFSPHDELLASGSYDGKVRVWDVRTCTLSAELLGGHARPVRAVAFSPSGRVLASGSDDMTIRLWDMRTLSTLGAPLEGHSDWIQVVTFSPDGTLLASGADDRTVRLWDVQARPPKLRGVSGEHRERLCCVTFSPDGALLASGSRDHTVRLWNAHTLALVREPLEGHSTSVEALSFSPNGALLASASEDGTIRLWDVASGSAVGDALEGHAGAVCFVAFSPDGAVLTSASDDGTVRWWDVHSMLSQVLLIPRYSESSDPLDIPRSDPLRPPIIKDLSPLSPNFVIHLDDGWVVGENQELVLWIPPAFRSSLSNVYEIARLGGPSPVKLDFSQFSCGLEWTDCYDPPPASSND